MRARARGVGAERSPAPLAPERLRERERERDVNPTGRATWVSQSSTEHVNRGNIQIPSDHMQTFTPPENPMKFGGPNGRGSNRLPMPWRRRCGLRAGGVLPSNPKQASKPASKRERWGRGLQGTSSKMWAPLILKGAVPTHRRAPRAGGSSGSSDPETEGERERDLAPSAAQRRQMPLRIF